MWRPSLDKARASKGKFVQLFTGMQPVSITSSNSALTDHPRLRENFQFIAMCASVICFETDPNNRDRFMKAVIMLYATAYNYTARNAYCDDKLLASAFADARQKALVASFIVRWCVHALAPMRCGFVSCHLMPPSTPLSAYQTLAQTSHLFRDHRNQTIS